MTRDQIAKMEENLKKEIADNLKRIIKEKGFSQIKLSEASGVPKSTISDYINEKTLANAGNIQKLADVLKVGKCDIDPSFKPNTLREQPELYEVVDRDFNNITSVPVVGQIAAGLPILAVDNIEGYMPVLSSLIDKNKKYFFLIVKGDSMNLEFQEGSFVLLEKTEEVENGQIGVVLINGLEATVKKISKINNVLTLIPVSTNPIHNVQSYDLEKEDIKIIGKVVQAVKVY